MGSGRCEGHQEFSHCATADGQWTDHFGEDQHDRKLSAMTQYLKQNEGQNIELWGNCIGVCRNEDDHDDSRMVRRWWPDTIALCRADRERGDIARSFGMLNAPPDTQGKPPLPVRVED